MAIEIDEGQSTSLFPRTIAAFGSAEFSRQVGVYNSVLSSFPDESPTARFYRLARDPYRDINRSVLNCLQVFLEDMTNPMFKRLAAPLLHLEVLLGRAEQAGYSPSSFSTMVRSPNSFQNVIAELDVGELLSAATGSVARHVLLDPASPTGKNFDIEWTNKKRVLRADVKWFRDWLVRPNGEELTNLIDLLIGKDLKHRVFVSSNDVFITDALAIQACEEVLELYRACTGTAPVVAEHLQVDDARTVAWYVEANPLKPQRIIKSVRVGDPKIKGSKVVLLQGLLDDGEQDRNAISRNLINASSQLPPIRSASEASCVFLGSHDYNGHLEVEQVLFGDHRVHDLTFQVERSGGLFSLDSAVKDLENLDGVVFFSFGYEVERASGDVFVWRFAKPYFNSRLSSTRKKQLIAAAAKHYGGVAERLRLVPAA